MRDIHEIIKGPILTEKTTDLKNKEGKYVFEVDRSANKMEIKRAIEELFKVKVEKVWTLKIPPKSRRVRGMPPGKRPARKKAIVKLSPGYSIELLTGI
jgi:large subunit ribosomal protein L23